MMAIQSLFGLDGKTALVTGASGHLGSALVEGLLSAGARVIAVGRSAEILIKVEVWASKYGYDKISGKSINMDNLPEAEIAFGEIANKENITILVNNAHEMNATSGFNSPSGYLEEFAYNEWMANLTCGAYWPAMTTRILGEKMKNSGGSIINISSMYAQVAPSPRLYAGTDSINPPGYSASKAAMLALTRYTASFWGKYDIRANAILPGPFPPMKGTLQPRLEERTCLGRTGKPDELVGPLLFLASPASSYVTGHSLLVDGGWTVT